MNKKRVVGSLYYVKDLKIILYSFQRHKRQKVGNLLTVLNLVTFQIKCILLSFSSELGSLLDHDKKNSCQFIQWL